MTPRLRRKPTALVRTENTEIHQSVMLLVQGQVNIDASGNDTVPKIVRAGTISRRSVLACAQRAPSASAETLLITSSTSRSSASIT
jgi:hypothetical protein